MPSGAYGYDVSGVQLSATTPERESLAIIAGATQGQTPAGGGGGGIPVVINQPTEGTRHRGLVAPSGTFTIPAGSKGYGLIIWLLADDGLTTLGGTKYPGGYSESSPQTTSSDIVIVTTAGTVSYTYYT